MNSFENNSDYKNDVAFSFVVEDDQLAHKINDLLIDRFSTYLYSKNIDETINKDGIEKFKSIFKKDSRIVVLLFRKKYGKTKWTSVEEDAIKERYLDGDKNFLFLIIVEDKVDLPVWIPENRIYCDLTKHSIEKIASYIEYRIHETGGKENPESFSDIIKRINRKDEFKKKKEAYLGSNIAARDALTEIDKMISYLEEKQEELISFNIHLIKNPISESQRSITYQWKQYIQLYIKWKGSINSTFSDKLYISIIIAPGDSDKNSYPYHPEYRFDILPSDNKGWWDGNKFYDSIQLIEVTMKKFLEIIDQENDKYY
jgi:hypothetical protein